MFTENLHRQPTFICPTSFQDLSVFKELPDLLWIHVFEQLTRSRDRYHVVQTCRKFYMLGLRELYSQLSFRHMSQFLDNVSFWEDRKDDMVSAPRSISVHGSFLSLSGRELFLRSNLAAAEAGTRAFLQIPLSIWVSSQNHCNNFARSVAGQLYRMHIFSWHAYAVSKYVVLSFQD
ncbi:hypothetical protein GYMLUDRAFT_48214 [Collybiopsis luxurians FD-317 M1]|uniref:F-box domain-containing protein n=1 Tax=Collybiopsis luxurians FD-317 M1 TaxID=944289 RepID=A0A0D0BK17_9AGAR|nr:hypothetical protein GYMLUDRAFT_48214 [Collybiopsis luxurians FD-317 M1]